MDSKMYKIRVIQGAFIHPEILDSFDHRIIEKLEHDPWVSIDEVRVTLDQVKELQKDMVRHFKDQSAPWYMDGYGLENKGDIIVAFGVDDGVGGKIFQFDRSNMKANEEVVAYGISKGIPSGQMGFIGADF